MQRARQWMLLLAACGCLVSACAWGRVFWRWGTASESSRALAGMGGRRAYSADVVLNGGEGRLEVFRFDDPAPRLVQALRQSFAPEDESTEGGMITMRLSRDGRVLRLLVVHLFEAGTTLVFTIDQAPEQAALSRHAPAANPLPSVPAFPGATPHFFARDGNTDTALLVSTTAAPVATVRDFYAANLSLHGWAPALGTSGASDAGVYLRNNALCCLLVAQAPGTGDTRITVLHKTQELD
jgi:hypothetical protein